MKKQNKTKQNKKQKQKHIKGNIDKRKKTHKNSINKNMKNADDGGGRWQHKMSAFVEKKLNKIRELCKILEKN